MKMFMDKSITHWVLEKKKPTHFIERVFSD
jgi:hypothetical protein